MPLCPFARQAGRAQNCWLMNINSRLYVEICPFDGPHPPHPHPIDEGHFDPQYVYKVLGMYNPSETSECYFVLANPQRQIWFIPQRHLLAYKLIDSDEFFIRKDELPVAQAPTVVQQKVAPPSGSAQARLPRGRIGDAPVQVRLSNPNDPQHYRKGF